MREILAVWLTKVAFFIFVACKIYLQGIFGCCTPFTSVYNGLVVEREGIQCQTAILRAFFKFFWHGKCIYRVSMPIALTSIQYIMDKAWEEATLPCSGLSFCFFYKESIFTGYLCVLHSQYLSCDG